MDHVTLPPELERFSTEAVAAGRYRDMSEVVQAGLSLLQRAEAEVDEFVASLEEASTPRRKSKPAWASHTTSGFPFVQRNGFAIVALK